MILFDRDPKRQHLRGFKTNFNVHRTADAINVFVHRTADAINVLFTEAPFPNGPTVGWSV